jgi:hypothetical protein
VSEVVLEGRRAAARSAASGSDERSAACHA